MISSADRTIVFVAKMGEETHEEDELKTSPIEKTPAAAWNFCNVAGSTCLAASRSHFHQLSPTEWRYTTREGLTVQPQPIDGVFLDEPADPVIQRGLNGRVLGIDVDQGDLCTTGTFQLEEQGYIEEITYYRRRES